MTTGSLKEQREKGRFRERETQREPRLPVMTTNTFGERDEEEP